jgi:hypothetical protein
LKTHWTDKMPKKPTPAELKDALGSFIVLDEVPIHVLDRSTIENAAKCPFLACAHSEGKINFPAVLHVGNEVHDALSRVSLAWIQSDGTYSPGELAEALTGELRGSRPDLQPDVIDACRASAWSWGQFLAHECHPGNILALDGGGEVDRSGQFAIDFSDLNVRATSEVDLLYSGPSPELLHEVDYKTGHKLHTAASVYHSFQFQFHAVLVFANFPEVNGLEVTIWNTRTNQRSYRVVFDRRKLPEYTARVRMAIQSHMTNVLPHTLDDPTDLPPTWPTWEKCSECEAAALCPAAGQDIGDVARDPVASLQRLIAAQAKVDGLAKALAAHVDATKQDIRAGSVCFGRNKPKSDRKAAAAVYEVKPDAE